MNFPILTTIVFLPLAGAAIIALFVDKNNVKAIKWIANLVAGVDFLLALLLLTGLGGLWPAFDVAESAALQFQEKVSWIPQIGVDYFLAADGISLLMVLLTAGIGVVAMLSSWTYITRRHKEYYAFMLLLQTGMLGVFVAFDFFLFYVFWEIMLVPMYFIIGIWGDADRLYAAIKFFLYTLFGSVLMLLGILALYFFDYGVTGTFSFDITGYYALDIPADLQWWIFLALFFGFAIKVPMFPFHTWLPDAHVQAPTAGSVILAGVLLKMGTYGFVRFSLPILPDASQAFVPWMVTLSIIAIIYGALVALMQKDWKSLVAYSSVSHMGFITLGIFALNPVGLQGGILQMVNHGISTGGLFLVVGLIYERVHTREIARFSGLAHVMPVFAALFAIMALSSMGLPGLNGFIGEFMVLVGAFQVDRTWAYFAIWGVVLAAAYLLWLYQRVMLGEVKDEELRGLSDLNLREAMTLVPLAVMALWIGLYPAPFLRILEPPVNAIVERVQPGYFAASDIEPPPLPSSGEAAVKHRVATDPVPDETAASESVPVGERLTGEPTRALGTLVGEDGSDSHHGGPRTTGS